MRDDDRWEELPEAVPLYRVAPLWRLLAIIAVIGMAVLLFAVLILGIVLVHMAERTVALPPPPLPPAVTVIGGGRPSLTDDAQADAQNLPYPMTADLAEGDPYEPAQENRPPTARPQPTARERFLDQGTDLWKVKGPLTDHLVISPDGESTASIVRGTLTAGLIGSQRQIVGTVIQPVPVPVTPGRGGRMIYTRPMVAYAETNLQLLGPPSWTPDNRFVYCADARGHLRRYNLHSGGSEGQADSQVLAFEGESPALLPSDPEKLVFVRSQPKPKPDVPGMPPTRDVTEVVLGDLNTKEVRVLVPASPSTWRYLAASPDGKRLALVSDRGHEGKPSHHLRVFVLDLAGGEPKPLTPPASQAGPVCWAADSQALIYARSQDPLPADYWEHEPEGPNGALDLYQWDLATNQETRLSRGGGCFSPSMSSNADLYYLAVQETGSGLLLRRVPLAAARKFAASEPQAIARDAAAWTGLLNDVLEDSKVGANLDRTALTPDVVARLAETFNKLYRERFQAEPPSTLKGFDRQRRELQTLSLSSSVQPALTLILGVLEGEYLVQHHKARWHLTKGPLLPSDKAAAESTVESPFGYVTNPIAAVSAWARQSVQLEARNRKGAARDDSLLGLLRRAEGRTLVLTNDAAAGQAAVAGQTDPDLGRASELLQQGQGEQAEQLFENLLKRHEHNLHLALQIGRLLYEGKRMTALQRLMEQQCERLPRDARTFNLLGLALLEAQPRPAAEAFKNALRCDLHFGPAYLNLAHAYQLANEPHSARMCLERYLALMPDGIYAADARRRLAAVDTNGK
jgi:hypothetical protein